MIGTALIGKGYWGSILERYLLENEHFDLKYVLNSKSSLEEVWKDHTVTAVVNATPNEMHYTIVKAALSHGKHVLTEKPLALRREQCEELRDIARSNCLVLLTEYTQTFSQALQKAQTMVKEGSIGTLLSMEMSVRHLGRFKGGSVYWLLASHMLSVLDMFVPIDTLSFEKRDLVTVDGNIETGVIAFTGNSFTGQIVVSLNFPGKDTRVILYGEDGTITYDPVTQPALQIDTYERIPWTVASLLPRHHLEFPIDESNNLRYAIDHFYRVLSGERRDNIDRAVAITAILEAIDRYDHYRYGNEQ